MKAEEILDSYCKFDSMAKFFKLRVITAMEDYARQEVRKAREPKVKKFKPSTNGIKLSAMIEKRFGIQLQPLIHRRYIDTEKVKFEMKDMGGNVYLFEGLVLEFLDPQRAIILLGKTFSVH